MGSNKINLFNRIVKIFLKCLILIIVGAIIIIAIALYKEQKKIFPYNIDSIYYVDNIKIKDIVVASINDVYYILPKSTISEYNGNDSLFIERTDVVEMQILDSYDMKSLRKSRINFESYLPDYYLSDTSRQNGIVIRDFLLKPKYFKVIFSKDYEYRPEWDSFNNKYSDDQIYIHLHNKYSLRLLPIFSFKERLRIRKYGSAIEP